MPESSTGRKLRLGIVGIGVGASEILPAMEQMAEFELVAAADVNPRVLETFRQRYGAKTYDSVDSIAEFFKQRATQLGNTGGSFQSTRERTEQDKAHRNRSRNLPVRTGSGSDRVDQGGSPPVRTGSGNDQNAASHASQLETRNSKPETF